MGERQRMAMAPELCGPPRTGYIIQGQELGADIVMTDVSIMEKNNRTEQRRDKVRLVIPLLFPPKLNQYVGYLVCAHTCPLTVLNVCSANTPHPYYSFLRAVPRLIHVNDRVGSTAISRTRQGKEANYFRCHCTVA
jgi:hypothetical protein